MTVQQGNDAPDRHGLVSAFAGHVSGARAGAGAKILAAVLVAVLAGGVVVGVGYLTRPARKPAARMHAAAVPPQGTATPPAKAPLVATDRSDGKPKYVAVAGYGCPSSSKASFSEHGWWADGLNGFISVRTGGIRTGGCDGSFAAMPMSGSTTYDDPANYALWTFHTGPVVHGLCHLSVYVPSDASIKHVGGDPAVYEVFGSAGASGPELGGFDVDQISSRGRWVSSHSWPVANGALTVKLNSYGIDWTDSSPTYAHIAVSAVSLTCVP
jgi:translation initiation factor IF-2